MQTTYLEYCLENASAVQRFHHMEMHLSGCLSGNSIAVGSNEISRAQTHFVAEMMNIICLVFRAERGGITDNQAVIIHNNTIGSRNNRSDQT